MPRTAAQADVPRRLCTRWLVGVYRHALLAHVTMQKRALASRGAALRPRTRLRVLVDSSGALFGSERPPATSMLGDCADFTRHLR